MRIIGALELGDLNALSEPCPRGAARAWHAEISAASWSGSEDLLRRHPGALLDGSRALFDLGVDDYCVIARFNYDVQLVSMTYFGPFATAPWPKVRARKAKSVS